MVYIHIFISIQLLGLGTALLENIDPNPENYVCAGVIQTKSQQIGCLLRLEPNAQAQVKRDVGGQDGNKHELSSFNFKLICISIQLS